VRRGGAVKDPARVGDRHAIRFEDDKAWTQHHRDWLAKVSLKWPAAQMTLVDIQGAIDTLTAVGSRAHAIRRVGSKPA